MSDYSIEILLNNLRNLDRKKRYKIHKLDLFSIDINVIIEGLEMIVDKENK